MMFCSCLRGFSDEAIACVDIEHMRLCSHIRARKYNPAYLKR